MIHLKRGMRHHGDEKREGKMQTIMNSNSNSSTQRFPIPGWFDCSRLFRPITLKECVLQFTLELSYEIIYG
jgi:hypothetical protein